jgi:hypothetical protein
VALWLKVWLRITFVGSAGAEMNKYDILVDGCVPCLSRS